MSKEKNNGSWKIDDSNMSHWIGFWDVNGRFPNNQEDNCTSERTFFLCVFVDAYNWSPTKQEAHTAKTNREFVQRTYVTTQPPWVRWRTLNYCNFGINLNTETLRFYYYFCITLINYILFLLIKLLLWLLCDPCPSNKVGLSISPIFQKFLEMGYVSKGNFHKSTALVRVC